MLAAMRARVLVAAVGPTCAAALDAIGVPPHVVPANPSMGAMIAALAGYLREEARA
jgi:uroporphyrinogen-III synthase